MGRKIVLTGTKLTDLNAPKLVKIDPIESSGSLVLIDPTHPYTQWAAGVPAAGAAVPNVFSENALALAGSAAGYTLSRGTGWGTANGLIERSGKGGLHGVPSPTLATASTSTLLLSAALQLETYIMNNPTHSFFFSSWGRITKPAVVPANSIVHSAVNGTSPAANRLAVGSVSNYLPANGRSAQNSLGGFIINHNPTAWAGIKPTTNGDMYLNAFGVVNLSWAFSDAKVRELGGLLHYRHYVEDLTVSGRTYAQVDAIDYAQYTKHVLTPGGRYYNDTYTDPATIV